MKRIFGRLQIPCFHNYAYVIFGMLFALTLLVFCAPLLPLDPLSTDLSKKFAAPSLEHWLGCDHLGRDVLSRLIFGAHTSLVSLLIISSCIAVFSFVVGIVAGFKGGIFDSVLMRICDVFFVFPTFILALFFIGILGVGIENVILSIVLTHWAWYARVVRSIVLEMRTKGFVQAARAQGFGDFYIMRVHIFPAVFAQMIILLTLDLGHMLLHIAALSFLGLGVQAPTPEWGIMIADSAPYIMEYPELMLLPGVCIFLTVALFNTAGEIVRDWLDPEEDLKRSEFYV